MLAIDTSYLNIYLFYDALHTFVLMDTFTRGNVPSESLMIVDLVQAYNRTFIPFGYAAPLKRLLSNLIQDVRVSFHRAILALLAS